MRSIDESTEPSMTVYPLDSRYQGLLNEIESSTPDAVKRHSGHTRGNSIISAEDTGSLSRSNSDESNIHNNSGTHLQLQPGAPPPNVKKGQRSRHTSSSSSCGNINNGSINNGSINNGSAINGVHQATPATNGRSVHGDASRHRSPSCSSAASLNTPATPLTPMTPHTPLSSPLGAVQNGGVQTSTTQYSFAANTPTSPGSSASSAPNASTTDSMVPPVGSINASMGPLSSIHLTGAHNIPPIEEEGRPIPSRED